MGIDRTKGLLGLHRSGPFWHIPGRRRWGNVTPQSSGGVDPTTHHTSVGVCSSPAPSPLERAVSPDARRSPENSSTKQVCQACKCTGAPRGMPLWSLHGPKLQKLSHNSCAKICDKDVTRPVRECLHSAPGHRGLQKLACSCKITCPRPPNGLLVPR